MDKNLLKNLNKLKEIKPDAEYTKQSRFLILFSSRDAKKHKIEFQKTSALYSLISSLKMPVVATTIFSVFVLIIGFSVFYVNQILSPIFLPELNQSALVAEANEMTTLIQISLNDVRYNVQELEDKNLADLLTINKLKVLLAEATIKLKEASNINIGGENLEMSLQKMKSVYEILQRMTIELSKPLIK